MDIIAGGGCADAAAVPGRFLHLCGGPTTFLFETVLNENFEMEIIWFSTK